MTAGVLVVAQATVANSQGLQLIDLSLEELGNIRVTSVSGRAEPLSDAAASVFVITGDDIRRTGVTSLPEALRLAPNLVVARTSASEYSISARGFNNPAGNKVLTLIDGRTVYSPLFSGVFWDAQEVLLEDVERIEVISGPGGTLWGTNAVNGVINIITRSARDTQSTLVAVGGGNAERLASARYGGRLGANGGFRVYGRYFDRDQTSLENGAAVDDEGHIGQVGFRADWERATDQFTVQGDVYGGDKGQPAPGMFTLNGISRLNPISIAGMNVLTRWEHRLDDDSNLTLLAYYDRTERDAPGTLDDTLDVLDVQFQHLLAPIGPHTVTWGADYRYGKDRIINDDFVAFLPADTGRTWGSLFAQDEIVLRDDVRLTFGARIERNDYTGSEFLPSARVAFRFTDDHLLWAAGSRTVRAPSRIDREFYFPADGPPFLLQGGAGFRSEVAQVYEVGVRGQPLARLTYALTAFHTEYDHLRTLEIAPTGDFLEFANEMDGSTNGFEMWGSYQATDSWRLSVGFTTLNKDLELKPGSDGLNGGVAAEGNDPDHSWHLRSMHTLAERWELDVTVRGIASLPLPAVPSYTAVDVRLAWRLRPDIELSIMSENVLDDSHAEFSDPLTRSEFGRTVFLKVVARM